MKPPPSTVRVLVVSDNVDDATQILHQLKGEFADIVAATDADTEVEDFERAEPEVLILAFDSVHKAQTYVLRLQRLSPMATHQGHRTVLLCNKEEVRAAFDLCRDGSFDDYVLHWPHAQDGLRLAMSVLSAARRDAVAPLRAPSNLDLITHVRQLGAVQSLVHQPFFESDGGAGADSPLRARLANHLEAMRSFTDKVRKIRPIVLVVEDDEFSHVLIERALADQGYELVFATDGAAALGLLRRIRPDLILMDVNLPGIDGVALTQRLKAQPELADIPVLMLTGEARRETLQNSINAGAAGFIVKPFARDALVAKLDRFLSTAG